MIMLFLLIFNVDNFGLISLCEILVTGVNHLCLKSTVVIGTIFKKRYAFISSVVLLIRKKLIVDL